MAISKKKIKQINRVSFIIEALESVEPKYSRTGDQGDFWWNHSPDTWDRTDMELWDLLNEVEDKMKAAILKILGVESE